MTVYALVSAGGSPGVTTSALALALSWPRAVMMAETDPSGADVLAGFFAGHLPGDRGLLRVAYEATSVGAAAAAVATQLVTLDEAGMRTLLPGLADPRQAATLNMTWHLLAGALAAQPCDVLVDGGRFDGGPGQEHILRAATKVALVLRPTLRQAAAARPRIEMLSQLMNGATNRLSLLVIGRGAVTPKELSNALSVPVLAVMPDDRKTALVLSDGGTRRGDMTSSQLLRGARTIAIKLAQSGGPGPNVPAATVATAGQS